MPECADDDASDEGHPGAGGGAIHDVAGVEDFAEEDLSDSTDEGSLTAADGLDDAVDDVGLFAGS